MVATTGTAVALVAVNAAISPDPLPARPIEGVLFVQLYTMLPPVVGLLNNIAGCVVLLQTTLLVTAFTVAVGLTVIVKFFGDPVQVTPPST